MIRFICISFSCSLDIKSTIMLTELAFPIGRFYHGHCNHTIGISFWPLVMKLWQRTDLVLDLWTEPSSSCTVQCYYQRTIDSARCFRVFFPSRVPETMIPSEPLVYRCWNHQRVRRLHIPHCEFWQKAQRYLEIDAVMRSVHHGKQCKRLKTC
jgi:hypothetical protein